MSAQSMPEQLLKSGLAMVESNTAGNAGTSGQQPVASDAGWGKFGAGAAAGGLAGLLLGSKRGRKIGGSALRYGSMAALGWLLSRPTATGKRNNSNHRQCTSTRCQPLQCPHRHSNCPLLRQSSAAKRCSRP